MMHSGASGCVPARWAMAAVAILALSPLAAARLEAQDGPAAISRIEALVRAGQDSVALTVADSILADTDPGAAGYADALYWRGVLLKGPAARVDLIRLTVDYPTHRRVADALYTLAQQDLASGDTDVALRRLDRIVRDFMSSNAGPQAAAQAGRLHLGLGQMGAACAAFDSALAHVPDEQVEFRNRTAYEARPCARWKEVVADSLAAAARASAKPGAEPATRPPGTGARSVAGTTATADGNTAASRSGRSLRGVPARSSDGRWTVQVAAFATQAEAERLRVRLVALGYDARVVLELPYRVRVGRFATRQSAVDVAARLKRQRFEAIIVEAEAP